MRTFTGGVSLGNGPNDLALPGMVEFVKGQLRARGIEPPSKPELVRIYMDWENAQPVGAETSPESFSRWFEAFRASGAA